MLWLEHPKQDSADAQWMHVDSVREIPVLQNDLQIVDLAKRPDKAESFRLQAKDTLFEFPAVVLSQSVVADIVCLVLDAAYTRFMILHGWLR